MPARRAIGVDMGGTKLLAGAVDRRFGVHHRAQRTVLGLDQTTLFETAVDAVEEARASAGAEIAAVGFGIPSLIDQRSGKSVSSVHLPLAGVPFADIMTERLGVPVFVDNDANLAILAEHRGGAARGCSEAAMLTLGTGIGGGLIIRGQLYRGAVGAAGELGHMVIDMDGPRCQGNCPSRGCIEAVASGSALAREAVRIAHERPRSGLGRAHSGGRVLLGPLITELAHDGDDAAIEAIELVGSRLGVIVGGGVIGAGELLLEPARRVVRERALAPSRDEVRVLAAQFGVEAGMIGAAALAFDRVEGRPV